MRDKDESAEQYWRERASSLRSEEATTLAQIDYVKQRLAEIPVDEFACRILESFWFSVRTVPELSASKPQYVERVHDRFEHGSIEICATEDFPDGLIVSAAVEVGSITCSAGIWWRFRMSHTTIITSAQS